MSNGNSQEGTQGMDSSTATRYWSDWLLATTSFWQGQIGRWSSVLRRMRAGTYDHSQCWQDLVVNWDAWAAFMAFPLQWGARQASQLPTLLLIVEGAAEHATSQDVPINVSLPAEVTTTASDLYGVGGTRVRQISARDHVGVRLTQERDRVSFSLNALGLGRQQRIDHGIDSGLYAGAIYAEERAGRIPIALLYALIEEPTLP